MDPYLSSPADPALDAIADALHNAWTFYGHESTDAALTLPELAAGLNASGWAFTFRNRLGRWEFASRRVLSAGHLAMVVLIVETRETNRQRDRNLRLGA